jgi:HK97 gp10 family phage protein
MLKASFALDLSPAERLRRSGIRKAVRIAANRAAAPVKAVMVANAERIKDRGGIAKSIRIRVKIYGDRFVTIIGPSRSYKRSAGRGKPKKVPASYAHLVERGTKRTKPKPFVRPTLAATKDQFYAAASREVGIEIAKELDRQRATSR